MVNIETNMDSANTTETFKKLGKLSRESNKNLHVHFSKCLHGLEETTKKKKKCCLYTLVLMLYGTRQRVLFWWVLENMKAYVSENGYCTWQYPVFRWFHNYNDIEKAKELAKELKHLQTFSIETKC